LKPRRPKRSQPDPESAGDLMSSFLARLGGSGRALEYRVFDAYAKAAGEMLASRSTPDSFRDGTLYVRTASSALAHELTLLRGQLLERMAGFLGEPIVRDLRTRVGGAIARPPK
jgi:predicted nucleic acid-binding Zn ribbon protein